MSLDDILLDMEKRPDSSNWTQIITLLKDRIEPNHPQIAEKVYAFIHRYTTRGENVLEAVKTMAVIADIRPQASDSVLEVLEKNMENEIKRIAPAISSVCKDQYDLTEQAALVLTKYDEGAGIVAAVLKNCRKNKTILRSMLNFFDRNSHRDVRYIASAINQAAEKSSEYVLKLRNFYQLHDGAMEAISVSLFNAIKNAPNSPQNRDKYDFSLVEKLLEFYREHMDDDYVDSIARVIENKYDGQFREAFTGEMLEFLEKLNSEVLAVYDLYTNKDELSSAINKSKGGSKEIARYYSQPLVISAIEKYNGEDVARIANKTMDQFEPMKVFEILNNWEGDPKLAILPLRCAAESGFETLIRAMDFYQDIVNDPILECLVEGIEHKNAEHGIYSYFRLVNENISLFEEFSGDGVYEFATALLHQAIDSNDLKENQEFAKKFAQYADVIEAYEGKLIKGVVGEFFGKIISVADNAKVAAVVKRYAEKGNPKEGLIPIYSASFVSWGDTLVMADVMDKYFDMDTNELYLAFRDQQNIRDLDINELLTDRAYNAMKRSKDQKKTLHKILSNNYGRRSKEIAHGDKIGYKELDLIFSTYKFVKGIHAKRNSEDMKEIREGFYSNLNRAIVQASDNKGMVRQVRQYCSEVRQKMEDNVDELMVIYDG